MACRKVILAEAQQEFRDIVGYLVGVLQSPRAAQRFMDEFDAQLALVSENPGIYGLSRVPELAVRGYRCASVGSYVMIYKVQTDAVVVAHIFHQSQDYARLV